MLFISHLMLYDPHATQRISILIGFLFAYSHQDTQPLYALRFPSVMRFKLKHLHPLHPQFFSLSLHHTSLFFIFIRLVYVCVCIYGVERIYIKFSRQIKGASYFFYRIQFMKEHIFSIYLLSQLKPFRVVAHRFQRQQRHQQHNHHKKTFQFHLHLLFGLEYIYMCVCKCTIVVVHCYLLGIADLLS